MEKRTTLLQQLKIKCNAKRYSIVTAESCTGGGLAYLITQHPQCSFLLERAYVVYSVSAKQALLKIPAYTLQVNGAVSKAIAISMAEGALKQSRAQVSMAITGVDEEEAKKANMKQGGHIWVACASSDKNTISKQIVIKGNRKKFCEKAILEALKVLVAYI